MSLKKKIITVLIGLVLFSAGGSTLWWILSERQKEQQEAESLRLKYGSETSEYIQRYEQWQQLPPEDRMDLPLGLNGEGKAKTKDEIRAEQQERLKADLDRLAAGEMTVYPFADDFYGKNWREQLDEYKKQKEKSEFILTGSIMCTLSGALIVGWFLVLNIARFLIWILRGLKNFVVSIFRKKPESDESSSSENQTEESGQEQPEKQPSSENQQSSEKQKQPEKKMQSEKKQQLERKRQNQPRDLSKVLMNTGWQQPEFIRGRTKIRRQKPEVSINSESCLNNKQDNDVTKRLSNYTFQKAKNTPEGTIGKEKTHSEQKNEKIAKVNHEQLNPIDNTLKDLTQQVSAIREYAAHQQNRLEKLQDGYDWNIIKSFCLRIIRCIDNIECRISQMSDQEGDVKDLEEVRDELIFALESSGVEQFEPEINSEYRGQKKSAEAIKDKTRSKNPEQKGKIEKVIRPGYQCFIDEENVRIVRPAQVRLYA